MTRMKMIEAIAEQQAQQYSENMGRLRIALTTGLIGLVENTDAELEDLYNELYEKTETVHITKYSNK